MLLPDRPSAPSREGGVRGFELPAATKRLPSHREFIASFAAVNEGNNLPARFEKMVPAIDISPRFPFNDNEQRIVNKRELAGVLKDLFAATDTYGLWAGGNFRDSVLAQMSQVLTDRKWLNDLTKYRSGLNWKAFVGDCDITLLSRDPDYSNFGLKDFVEFATNKEIPQLESPHSTGRFYGYHPLSQNLGLVLLGPGAAYGPKVTSVSLGINPDCLQPLKGIDSFARKAEYGLLVDFGFVPDLPALLRTRQVIDSAFGLIQPQPLDKDDPVRITVFDPCGNLEELSTLNYESTLRPVATLSRRASGTSLSPHRPTLEAKERARLEKLSATYHIKLSIPNAVRRAGDEERLARGLAIPPEALPKIADRLGSVATLFAASATKDANFREYLVKRLDKSKAAIAAINLAHPYDYLRSAEATALYPRWRTVLDSPVRLLPNELERIGERDLSNQTYTLRTILDYGIKTASRNGEAGCYPFNHFEQFMSFALRAYARQMAQEVVSGNKAWRKALGNERYNRQEGRMESIKRHSGVVELVRKQRLFGTEEDYALLWETVEKGAAENRDFLGGKGLPTPEATTEIIYLMTCFLGNLFNPSPRSMLGDFAGRVPIPKPLGIVGKQPEIAATQIKPMK